MLLATELIIRLTSLRVKHNRQHPCGSQRRRSGFLRLRLCVTEQKTLKDIRASVLKHIKDTYLKRVDAPVGVKPKLKCWMEINEG
jgi:hypothetical protein